MEVTARELCMREIEARLGSLWLATQSSVAIFEVESCKSVPGRKMFAGRQRRRSEEMNGAGSYISTLAQPGTILVGRR